MSSCNEKHHENHPHQHGKGCGHTAIRHGDMLIICTMAIFTIRMAIT